MLALAGASSLTTLGLLLAGLAVLGLWAQKRRTEAAGVQRRTIPLGGQHALHVVELEGRRLVVGTGPGAAPRLMTELSPLAEVPTPTEVSTAAEAAVEAHGA